MKDFSRSFGVEHSIRKQLHCAIVLSLTVLSLSLYLPSQSRDSIRERRRPLAKVAGNTVYEDELPSSVQAQCRGLRHQEFELEKKALDQLVRQRLLENEAKKRGTTPDKLLDKATEGKSFDPTEAELDAYYLAQRDRMPQPFDDVKAKLEEDLKAAKVQEAKDAYVDLLLEQADIVILLRPPRIEVGYDEKRLKGKHSAPVTIVEFSDFSCPFCRQAESTLKELLAKYDGKVSLAYRDFPLREVHPLAESLAEAARCASEQGRFWEYHDLVFENANADPLENAAHLQLDEKQFKSCLTSGKYKPLVDKDLEEAIRSGVSGTPGFFINGIYLAGSQPKATFEKIIDEELADLDRDDLHANK